MVFILLSLIASGLSTGVLSFLSSSASGLVFVEGEDDVVVDVVLTREGVELGVRVAHTALHIKKT